jgi:hypothetical protein
VSGAGGAIAGIFLLVCGICLLLVGGGCTIAWLWAMLSAPATGLSGLPLLLLSAATAWAGIMLVRAAGRSFRG